MNRVALVPLLALVVAVSGCGDDGEGGRLPGGTFAGSTADDKAFVLEVGEDLTVNRRAARFVGRGVVEVRAGADGVRKTVTCKVSDDKGEELHCTLRTSPPGGPTTTEVLDLMLL